jgi:limonene-1,2-epoxide hydrolase
MLDTVAIERMVEEQIKTLVNDQVLAVLTSDEWLIPLEQKILKYTQDRILSKFANASTMPEIIEAVKTSVGDLFDQGLIPGIDQYVDQASITQSVDVAVQGLIEKSITHLGQDPVWLEKIERQINQAVVQRTISHIASKDINTVIHERVDENMTKIGQQLATNFASTGIRDTATSCQLTVMDDTTVIENQLTTRDINIVGSATLQNLIVKGTINTDNHSWNTLADSISEKTLERLSEQWRESLVDSVTEAIQEQGINFDTVKIHGRPLVEGNTLAGTITETNIQSVGTLKTLRVSGAASLYETAYVVNRRVGINTEEPEMALSVWDEEVSVVIGKNKAKQAYIGTNRDQGIVIGVNRISQLEIDTDGLTTVKKLRVGVHRIGHEIQVPGYAGTRGDLVFSSDPGPDRPFAWVCLGGYKWQPLKSAQ